jgi:malate/lactate dehydrogenase
MLGSEGVTKVVEIDLEENELDALKAASKSVKTKVEELNSIIDQ